MCLTPKVTAKQQQPEKSRIIECSEVTLPGEAARRAEVVAERKRSRGARS